MAIPIQRGFHTLCTTTDVRASTTNTKPPLLEDPPGRMHNFPHNYNEDDKRRVRLTT